MPRLLRHALRHPEEGSPLSRLMQNELGERSLNDLNRDEARQLMTDASRRACDLVMRRVNVFQDAISTRETVRDF